MGEREDIVGHVPFERGVPGRVGDGEDNATWGTSLLSTGFL